MHKSYAQECKEADDFMTEYGTAAARATLGGRTVAPAASAWRTEFLAGLNEAMGVMPQTKGIL